MSLDLDLEANVDILADEFSEALRRAFSPEIIDVDRWAEKNRRLTTDESPIPGAYRVSAVEVARGPYWPRRRSASNRSSSSQRLS
ncbi:hypothetical protein FLP41_15215 [Paracoccus marcusii]|uniref:hypothetical protein n=1 Tax=Paracoccus marcusii TaxID=59779 RepID=UPI002ED084BA|nr:hypothetical protein FLP41_15215 [Paracoccus marcusii]